MADSVVLSLVDGSGSVTIPSSKVEYTLDKTYNVDVKEPVFGAGNDARKIMDMKDINRGITITGAFKGPNSYDDFIALIALAISNNGDPLKLVWRAITFTNCWIKQIHLVDNMSISGTTADGSSQNFDSDQITTDAVTYSVTILLILGDKLGA
ncbi:MAG: hypothetical protein WC307_07090 [Candidatus Nanoarchaeia archaeon]|jgi:hypothetical protein